MFHDSNGNGKGDRPRPRDDYFRKDFYEEFWENVRAGMNGWNKKLVENDNQG